MSFPKSLKGWMKTLSDLEDAFKKNCAKQDKNDALVKNLGPELDALKKALNTAVEEKKTSKKEFDNQNDALTKHNKGCGDRSALR